MNPIFHPLFEMLSSFVKLETQDLESLAQNLQITNLEKGEYWFKEGQLFNKTGFIVKGFIRKFYHIKGKDITEYFYLENSFAGDLPSTLSGKSLLTNAIAMEDTTIFTISYENLNILCKNYPNIEHLLRIMLERSFIFFYYRTNSFITQTPKERYDSLIKYAPDILKRTAQYHVASYLGITPQHLSRLRSNK